jgi:hypothetical protein
VILPADRDHRGDQGLVVGIEASGEHPIIHRPLAQASEAFQPGDQRRDLVRAPGALDHNARNSLLPGHRASLVSGSAGSCLEEQAVLRIGMANRFAGPAHMTWVLPQVA